MLTEAAARWVLVLHTALGVAAVGAATHLVVWSRGFLRGSFGRLRAVRRFAWIALVLQLCAFAAGNVMYPTYKVEVRSAYLENRDAIVAEQKTHAAQLDRLAHRERAPTPVASVTGELVRRAAAAARWFDVKEHWVALGILASIALVLVLAFWRPNRTAAAPRAESSGDEAAGANPATGIELAPVVLGLAIFVAATVWLGAIIGILTASWRAV